MTDKEFQDRLIGELKNMGIGQRKWHTEKGVPIAVLLMFAGQLLWATWYGSSVASDVKSTIVEVEEIKATHITRSDAKLFEQTIKINQELIIEIRKEQKQQINSMYRIERKLDILDTKYNNSLPN